MYAALLWYLGHSKAITGLAVSQDNSTLVSSSSDGSLRVWNVWTRQCLRESKPLNKAAISNMLVRRILYAPTAQYSTVQ